MTPEDGGIDVFLQPGDLYFGDEDTKIRTVLGSCVSLTFWHPALRIGGMSHCLLPSRGKGSASGVLDGRYVDEALPWLTREIVAHGTRPGEYEIKLFGGADMFPRSNLATDMGIGRKNVGHAVSILERMGMTITTKDVGGTVSRSLIFDLASGDVWVRRGTAGEPPLQKLAVAA